MIFNYKRVSTTDQNTERQLLDIACDRAYIEKISGKNTDRPELQAMLPNIRAGDVVNVHSMDRLARNTKDLLNLVEEITAKGAKIVFHKENSIFAISFQSKRLYNINIIHMKLSKLLFIPLTGLFMGGCDMIDYHPYDVRISGQTDINNRNIEKIEANCKDKATIRFVTMGDSQRWYDETLDFVNHLNKRDDIDFVIHGGDYSDFGVTDEFLWQRDIMNKLKVPYVGLIGNHDCLGTGEETFRIVFGDPNFSFIAGRIKFVCLNTNAIEFDYSRPIPDFEFINAQLDDRRDEYDRTIFSMHIRPFCFEFNNNVAQAFQYSIKQFPGLLFCTAAHEHRLFEEDLFEDGVMYYMSDCMKHRSYYIFTVTPDGYEREVVYY